MPGVLRFKTTNVPRQQGELARLKIVQGPDYGAIYVVTIANASVGRGEENDIVISDLKASRRHAQFKLSDQGWEVMDAGSANGILWNGKATPRSIVKTGDVVTIGETLLEFVSDEAATKKLIAPPPSPSAIAVRQAAASVSSLKDFGKNIGSRGSKAAAKSFMNPRALLIAAGAILGLLTLMEDDKPKTRPAAAAAAKTQLPPGRDLASFLPTPGSTSPGGKTAEGFFRSGFREYRLGNFLRARSHFETVLQLAPGHLLASIYLENSRKKLDEEIKFHLDRGRKSIDSGKVRTARGHFEAVMRLLFRDPANPAFVEARDQLEKMESLSERGTG
jgi:hypothetical protein